MTLVGAWEDELPIEEDDTSATEPHEDLVARVTFGLRHRLTDTLVLGDIFIRRGRQQVAPDVFTVPGGERGARSIYRLEEEPVPEVTIEVLSAVNKHDPEGVAQLHRKRQLLGEIGVAEHIELDPIDGVILVYRSRNGVLEFLSADREYTSERLGGVRFVVDLGRSEGIAVYDASGEEFEEPQAAMARADAAEARAAEASARIRSRELCNELISMASRASLVPRSAVVAVSSCWLAAAGRHFFLVHNASHATPSPSLSKPYEANVLYRASSTR